MSDLRARLVDALREHQFYPCTDETPGGCIGSTCHWHGNWWPQWWDHMADVLLSLPGIAIVELPTKRLVPLTCPQTFTPHELAPAEMRYFAAKLLSAANAAEDADD